MENITDAPVEEATKKPQKPKKPKLTKAEKKLLRLREAQNLKKRLIREELVRELALTQKSLKKGLADWEETCKAIKLKELREDVQEWAIKFERIHAQKEEMIVRQMKNLELSEEMNERNYAKHVELLDYLLDSFQALRERSKMVYEFQASEVIQDFYNEINESEEIQAKVKYNFENIMHATNVIVEKDLVKDQKEYLERKFDEVNVEIEKRYIMRDQTIEKMNELHSQLLGFIKSMRGEFGDVNKERKRSQMLVDRQGNFETESAKLTAEEQSGRKQIFELQRELLGLEVEANRKLQDLKLEQKYYKLVRDQLKEGIDRDQQEIDENLKLVTSESYQAIKGLKKHATYGEHLLGLAACCRKHQTQKEKVIPYGDAKPLDDEDTDDAYLEIMTLDLTKHLDLSEEELADQIKLLKNFWKRQSLVQMQNLMLLEEKRKLTEENEEYRTIIKSMSKSEDPAEDLLQAMGIISIVK